MHLEIKQLSECPEHLSAVGLWIYEQWWRTPENTPEIIYSRLRGHHQRDRIPFTLVAMAGRHPIGSCCVIENDCAQRPQYTPWVAAVFVKEEYRHHGIGSRLLQEARETAGRMGVKKLYLTCKTTTSPLYQMNGWHILERGVEGPDSVVMTLDIAMDTRTNPDPRPSTVTKESL